MIYDPQKPLISIHIPKCAGTSFGAVLKKWFGWKYHRHYFDEPKNVPPKSYKLKPKMCIHGHFNHSRGIGVQDYYPGTIQFITMLRDPFWAHVSLFKFRSQGKGLYRNGEKSDIPTNIYEFFEMRPNSLYPLYLPCNENNYKEVLDSFVYIGIVEDLQESVDKLAGILGKKRVKVPYKNASYRWAFDSGLRRQFKKNNELAFAIYRYVLNEQSGTSKSC